MTTRRRRGLIEIAAGCAALWLLLTAAEGGLPPELLTVGGITMIFTFGAGYADIRSKASAAHRRLDEKRDADKDAARELRGELEALRRAIHELTIALARAGIDMSGGHGT